MPDTITSNSPAQASNAPATGTETIRLSVALVTRNRADLLRRCLESWRRQSVQPAEIVVSDDSDDKQAAGTETVAREFGAVYTRGPRRGLYANRNSAALACTGTHILTGDDDHTHPGDYVERVMETLRKDPARIWVFGEKHPARPEEAVQCPAELGDRGAGVAPANPNDCAAIADGSSVYPRGVFASGPVYDDTYPFGYLWYLMGWELKRRGYTISYSPSSFVWHHVESASDRTGDRAFLQRQLEANLYVLFVLAFHLRPSFSRAVWALMAALRVAIVPQGFMGYTVRARLTPAAILRAWNNARGYGRRHSAR